MAIADVFSLQMGGEEDTNRIILALGISGFLCDRLITQTNFPIYPSKQIWTDELEIFDPELSLGETSFNEQEGLAFIARLGLIPPTYVHAIQFAKQYGARLMASEEKPYIVFLHRAVQISGCLGERAMRLNRGQNDRGLYLRNPSYRATHRCLIAGVRSQAL